MAGRAPEGAARPQRLGPDVLRVCLALLIVMNVSRIHQVFGFLSAIRPGMLLIGLALMTALANPRALARWTPTR